MEITIIIFVLIAAFVVRSRSQKKNEDHQTQEMNETSPAPKKKSGLFAGVVIVIAFLVLSNIYSNYDPDKPSAKYTPQQYKNKCQSVEYSQVERNPSEFEGMMIKVTGEVIQVSEGYFNSITLRIDSSGDIWYATYKRNDNDERILEDDIITVYGECEGVETYRSVLGSSVTIPAIDIAYFIIEEQQ